MPLSDRELGEWRERYRESLRRSLRILAALPDDTLDELVRTFVDSRMIRGKGQKSRTLAFDTAAGDVMRAMSRLWAEAYGEGVDARDIFEQAESEETFFDTLSVLAAFGRAIGSRQYLRLSDEGPIQFLARSNEEGGNDDGA